jgi:hypothetical protein
LSPEPHFAAPVFGKVVPARIHALYQRNLLLASPAFDLLFARDCHVHVLVAFVIYQAMALVFLGETFNRIVFVLMDAPRKKPVIPT